MIIESFNEQNVLGEELFKVTNKKVRETYSD